MKVKEKYMKIHIDRDSIYLKEEICGVEIDSARLNSVTRATLIQFIQFFNERYRIMPLVIKNELEYLTVIKSIVPMDKPLKGAIVKLTDEYIALDISRNIDNESFKLNSDVRVLPDIRQLFENV